MSSRLSTSQPVTIETELIPLVDNFWLEANGQTEQWYYDNTGEYAPDRSIIPLIITPNIKATDTDSHAAYTPNFYTVEWYVQQWNGTAWVRTKVTNTTDTPANPFVIVGNTLKVNKNVESPQYGITIDCEATYIDPRDAGVTYPVRDSLTLTMNKDATVPYPKIQVLAESAQSFNPLKDSSSYDFKAEADWKGVSGDNGSLMYKADALGTEEIVQRTGTLPTTTPIIGNLRYGRGTGSTLKENQSFMFRQTSGGTVNPVPQNLAGIEKLKGNTVVWNQLANINAATAFDANSITVTNNNNIFEINIIKAGSGYNVGVVQDFIATIVGHKYYFSYRFKCQDVCQMSSDIWGQMTASIWAPANVWSKYAIITQAPRANTRLLNRIYPSKGNFAVGDSYLYATPQLIDLTLMFGAGNEPSTVEEFEAMFPEPYYAYDAGRLLSFNPAGLKTVGFNLWDEEWEMVNGYLRSKNYIKIIPNKTYYLRDTNHVLWKAYCYDGNYNQLQTTLTSATNGWTIGFPQNAVYAKFEMHSSYGNTYHNDICLNLSDASKNGTYEPYWENTCPIDITTLKGRATGSTTDVVMFPDGLCSAGSVYDEIDLKNGRAVKRIGKVDLGSLTWYYAQVSGFADRFSTTLPLAKPAPSNSVVANILSEKYSIYSDGILGNVSAAPNKGIALNTSRYIYVRDTGYSNATTFKTAMSGVYLYYELATPIEYTFDPIPQGQFEWYGVSNGVEVKIDTLPAYVSGQGTDTLRVDALYDENMTVICRYRKFPWDTELIPQKEYRTVAWRVPNIDTIVVCKNGGSVNSASTGNYIFETIVNVKGEMISDEVKAANLRFCWKMRKSNTTTETDLGWGLTKSIAVSDLKSTVVNGNPVSTIVYCEVYLLGAYEPVTTNGVTTYERNIDLS